MTEIDRQALIEIVWQSLSSNYYLSKETCINNLNSCLVALENVGGKMAVTYVSNGPEFHFVKVSDKYVAKKSTLKRYPGSLIEKFGYAETCTPISDERQHRFNRAVGFYETHRSNSYVYYRIEKLRGTVCR